MGYPCASVEDFYWRLNTIENDLRRLPQNLCVLLTHTPLTGEGARYSLFGCRDRHRLGTHTASWFSEGKLPFYPSIGQSTDRFPFGVVLSRTPALVQVVKDAERTWLNFGGKRGFYVSGASVRDSLPEGKGAEWTEGIIWHYFAKSTVDPITKESSFESVYEQLLHCYRGILETCRDLDDLLSIVGDELYPCIDELEWPEVLLYLGWKKSHPLLRVEHESVVRSSRGEELIPFGVTTGKCHDVFRICPASVAIATSYALEVLRRMVHVIDATASPPQSRHAVGGDADDTPEATAADGDSEGTPQEANKRKAKSTSGFTIFVEGADTEPAKLPVYCVDGEKHALRICEGLRETEYAAFEFSSEPWTKSDLGRIPAWYVMIEDVRNGVYGDIVAGISNMAERMHEFMSAPDRRTDNAGSTTGAAQVDETPVCDERQPAAPLKRPSKKAFQAWYTRDVLGICTQTEIAEAMTKQGTCASQGEVSKWLRQVEEYRKSGGLMPTLDELSKPHTDTVDPAVIDMGARQDGLTLRQRLRPER